MITANEKEVFFYGSGLVAAAFEYVLIFVSLTMEGSDDVVPVIIVALLSIFVFSLSGEIFLFSEGRLSQKTGMPPLIRYLAIIAVFTTGIALIISFALLAQIGHGNGAIADVWFGFGGVAVFLCGLLAPRVLMQFAAFSHLVRMIGVDAVEGIDDYIGPMLKRLGHR